LINHHQRPSLVEVCDRETDAELHRRNGQAPFDLLMLLIPLGYFLAAPREIARSLQLAPDGLDTVVLNFLAVMRGICLALAAIQVVLAHQVRRQPTPPPNA